ncbi:MAG: hypothetical protein JXR96_03025 [Deltaproteobacteria bacterium]|nr:hypothetical protein [Deltaproteobacteria bacterium]
MKTRRGEARRGNAMILAVLMLLALTSVGILAVERTNTDLLAAGNVIRAERAELAGEASMAQGLALLSRDAQRLIFELEQRNVAGLTTVRTAKLLAMSTAVTDPANVDKDRFMSYISPASGSEVLARKAQDMAMESEYHFVDERKDVRGSDVDANICNYVVDINGVGGIPSRSGQSPEDALNASDSVVVEVRGRGLVGPAPCLRR